MKKKLNSEKEKQKKTDKKNQKEKKHLAKYLQNKYEAETRYPNPVDP